MHDLWLTHVPSYLPDRLAYIKYMLKWAGLLDEEAFTAAVTHIKVIHPIHNSFSIHVTHYLTLMCTLTNLAWS